MEIKKQNNIKIKIKNIKSKIENYFKLTPLHICFISSILSIYMLLSILSNRIPGIFSAAPYLKIELTNWVFLVLIHLTNLFYTLICVIIFSFFREIYVPSTSFPVGNLSLIFVNIGIVLIYFTFLKILSIWKTNYLLKLGITSTFILILGTSWILFINRFVIFPLYSKIFYINLDELIKLMWSIFLPFNILNLIINLAVFIGIYPVLFLLLDKYHVYLDKDKLNLKNNINKKNKKLNIKVQEKEFKETNFGLESKTLDFKNNEKKLTKKSKIKNKEGIIKNDNYLKDVVYKEPGKEKSAKEILEKESFEKEISGKEKYLKEEPKKQDSSKEGHTKEETIKEKT